MRELERLAHNPGLTAIENEQVDMAQQETDRLNETRGGLDDQDTPGSSDRFESRQAFDSGDWESHPQGHILGGTGGWEVASEEAESQLSSDSSPSDASETPSDVSGGRPPVSAERVTTSDEASSPTGNERPPSIGTRAPGDDVEDQREQQPPQVPGQEQGFEDDEGSQSAKIEQDEDENRVEITPPRRRGKRRRRVSSSEDEDEKDEEAAIRESKRAR